MYAYFCNGLYISDYNYSYNLWTLLRGKINIHTYNKISYGINLILLTFSSYKKLHHNLSYNFDYFEAELNYYSVYIIRNVAIST